MLITHNYDQQIRHSKHDMRTRGTDGKNVSIESCTEFTLHVSQQSLVQRTRLLDYSEKKLIKYIDTISDVQQKLVLYSLLHDYIKGHVALAWKRGQPIYIKVMKEDNKQ